jgi:hypothetical protein
MKLHSPNDFGVRPAEVASMSPAGSQERMGFVEALGLHAARITEGGMKTAMP